MEDRPLLSSQEDLKKVTSDCIKLYLKSLPPNRLPILVAQFNIDDVVPEPDEIAGAIRRLRNKKSPGPTKIRAEHIKEWVKEAYREHHPYQGNWNRVVDLIQNCFRDQQVPTQLSWSTVVLLPKGNNDYRGIVLLEISWIIIEPIINRRIASKVEFHDALYGFLANRGTGTTCIEAKTITTTVEDGTNDLIFHIS